jgi:RNA polymerase sigma-70 factor (ECF subfamily)
VTAPQALRQYALTRDAEAFRLLVEQYQRLVYSAASRRLSRVEDIEDVVQVTFLKLAKAAGAIRRDLSSWLYVTAINTANDLIRRDQTRRRHETASAPPEALSADSEREEWNKLSAIIDDVILELPKSQRSLIVEHFFRGRTQRDLADELNISQPTVLRRIKTAVDELRRKLASRGCDFAAPSLVVALERITQPHVSPSVTAQLVKIGLSGLHDGTVSLLASSTWLKIGLAAVVVAIAVGAIVMLTASNNPIAAQTPSPHLAAPATAPTDWHAAFLAAYALKPGQNLKFIPPPPLPERQEYLLRTENNNSPMPFIQWRWIDGNIKREWMEGSGPTGAGLASVLSTCARLDQDHISIAGLPPIDADGDWIVRDSATTPQILHDLRIILHDHFKVDAQFQKNEVTKDALVATGQYHFRRLPDASSRQLQVYSDVLDHPKLGDSVAGGGTSPPSEFWSMLGGYLAIPIVDESTHEPKKFNWALSWSISKADTETGRNQILKNISQQTGLVFTPAKRTFTTWKAMPANQTELNSTLPSTSPSN